KPKAAFVGSGDQLTVLMLVPNGTLIFDTNSAVTGAFLARDIDVSSGVRVTFQDGFNGCTAASCNDSNPCTADACNGDGTCSHTNLAAGTSCGDGNACNGDETCNGSGACVAGTPVTC